MPGRPRTRPERDDVRQRVLTAAREVFAEVGYHRATLNDIAARAGFSKGAVYSNFASKADLFLALAGAELFTRVDRLSSAARRARTADGQVTALARALVDLVTTEYLANVLFAEFRSYAARDAGAAEQLGRLRTMLTDAVAAVLAAGASARGQRLAMPATQAATTVLALVNGLSLEQVGRSDPVVGPAAMATVLRSLFLPE